MSTIQISALPAASAITADDLLPIEHDPSGTPVTQKATAAIFAAGVRGIAGAYVTTNIVPSGATSLTVNAAQADVDVRIKGDTDAALVFLDAGTNRVGIGTATPTTLLDVSGTLKATAFTGSGASLTGLVGTAQEFQSLASDPASPSNGDVWYNTTSNTFKGRRNGTNQTFGASSYVSATGGTITTDGNFKVHTFTSSGTFTVTALGPTPVVQYLVVAGGGGGTSDSGCAGGGGGFLTATGFTVAAQAYTITVGGGGAASTNGSDSIFSTITSSGGGRGGSNSTGYTGGSGGGGSATNSSHAGGAGNTPSTSPSQGNAGGNGLYSSPPTGGNVKGGGGGGGAGATGSNGSIDTNYPRNNHGGNGGSGTASSITGTSIYWSGGGGGGCQGETSGPTYYEAFGGNGAHGAGAGSGGYGWNPHNGTSGSGGYSAGGVRDAGNNTGGGAGGNQASETPVGVGGSGIVILRYQFQ